MTTYQPWVMACVPLAISHHQYHCNTVCVQKCTAYINHWGGAGVEAPPGVNATADHAGAVGTTAAAEERPAVGTTAQAAGTAAEASVAPQDAGTLLGPDITAHDCAAPVPAAAPAAGQANGADLGQAGLWKLDAQAC